MSRTTVSRALSGDQIALGKLLTEVESGRGRDLLRRLHARTGKAFIVGFTGPPGAGKSSLISLVAKDLAARGRRVGVIAVDPSSPFSGGAFLGDRVRMVDVSGNERVFIRSLGTRGHGGAVSAHTADLARVLDAAGYDIILIETVGAGQSDVEIVRMSHAVVVISIPGAGDDIQFAKAGILEIGSIFVVNKGDQEGWDHVFRDLEMELGGRARRGETLFKTSAKTGEGVKELSDGILRVEDEVRRSGQFGRLRRTAMEARAHDLLRSHLGEEAKRWMESRGGKLIDKGDSPEEVAEAGTREVLGAGATDNEEKMTKKEGRKARRKRRS